uniref:PHD-type domain-containing protein n=1 Tax=Clastoptera arizonana TaxID=38151 RepID=A0A1B6D2Z5_9HEMI
MSEIRHRDRILEAIDQLRKRKARPDVNRICSFMFRRFAVNCVETKLDLQKLIDEETVIKVDYKGNTSYRNAAKWAMLPSYKYKKEADTSSLLSSAVAELIVLEPDYLDIGVPGYELESHMIQRDSRRFSKKNLESILKREVEIGTLVKLDNGNYFLGEHSSNSSSPTMSRSTLSNVGSLVKSHTHKANIAPKQTSPRQKKSKISPKQILNDSNMKADDQGNSSSETANVGFRVGGRQKRARIVFDPSDNNLPRVTKKRGPGRPLGSGLCKGQILSNPKPLTPNSNIVPKSPLTISSQSNGTKPFEVVNNHPPNPGVCSICHSYGIRVKGVPERLISCSDCTTRAHPSCLENGKEGAFRNKNGSWQCVHCKTCQVCDETAEVGSLAICNSCSEAYHYQCHSPIVPEKARAGLIKWHCFKCNHNQINTEGIKIEPPSPPQTLECDDIKEESSKLPPSPIEECSSFSAEVPADCLQDPYEGYPLDETIPDVSDWTINQVYEYFLTQLSPELAQIFQEQELDGQSLLLLKRHDVLKGFNIKLGPALKIYGHIKKLQIRRSDLKLLWS